LLPPFRRRIVEVPMRLHHPVWIDDPDFDLSFHIRRVGCPAPGGVREFCEMASDIASRQLDRSRPLWEIWVVEGLEDGNIGFVAKIHHTVADGVAAAGLLANVAGVDPDEIVTPPSFAWHGEPVPTDRRLLRDAARDLWAEVRGLPKLIGRTARGMRA